MAKLRVVQLWITKIISNYWDQEPVLPAPGLLYHIGHAVQPIAVPAEHQSEESKFGTKSANRTSGDHHCGKYEAKTFFLAN